MINLRILSSLAKAKPAPEAMNSSLAENLDAEKLTRRAALRRIGMIGGLAVVGTLSIDDLARVSAKKLQQNELTRGIGNSLAQDFRKSGVAFADTLEIPNGYYMGGRKKKPCESGGTNWKACAGDGNRVLCCQDKCYECCETGGCGLRSDAVVHACQQKCANLNGSGI